MSLRRSASRAVTPTVRRIDAASVAAAWGAPKLLRPFTDRPAAVDGVEAELWYGAHPRHPSTVHAGGRNVAADALPDGERPDFLVKLLAAGAPLSIQVHPDGATAQRGFAAEEAAGVPHTSPSRSYVDASGKPEIIRALTPMRVLCGLRPAHASRALLSRLAPDGADLLLEALAHGDGGLADAVALLLRADAVTVALLLAAVADGARDVVARSDAATSEEALVDPALERVARLAIDLQSRHPGDVGAVVALLLEDIDLAPGEALWVAPGTPHAYLSGLGLELMESSDNTLRAGLTVKHVDVDEFLAVLDPSAVGARFAGTLPRTADGVGWRRRILPSAVFLIDEADLNGALAVERDGSGPSVLLCTSGRVTVRGGDTSRVDLGPGGAALLASSADTVTLDGRGSVVRAVRVSPASPALTTA